MLEAHEDSKVALLKSFSKRKFNSFLNSCIFDYYGSNPDTFSVYLDDSSEFALVQKENTNTCHGCSDIYDK